MTYEVQVKNHSEKHTIEADTFVHDKGGLTFFKNEGEAPVGVAFFPSSDVEFVKEKK